MRNLVWSLILILFYFMLGCSEFSAEKFNQFNMEAYKHRNTPDSSIYYANLSLENNSDAQINYYSLLLIGNAYDLKGDYQNAMRHYVEALNIVPDKVENYSAITTMHNNLGRIFKVTSNYDLAESHYTKALSFAKENEKAGIIYNLANVHLANNKEGQAVELYFDALEIAMNNNQRSRQAKCYNQIGNFHTRIGKSPKAREYFNKMLTYDIPEKYYGTAYHNIGNSYMIEDNYEEAIKYIRKALVFKKGSERFISYKDLGICYQKINQYDSSYIFFNSAVAIYNQVEIEPKNIALFQEMKETLKHLKQYDRMERNSEFYANEMMSYAQTRDELLKEAYSANVKQSYSSIIEKEAEKREKKRAKIIIWIVSVILSGIISYFIYKIWKYKSSVRNLVQEFS